MLCYMFCRCVVIEDSIVGLKAAKGAGMRCIITYTESTENEDFYGYVRTVVFHFSTTIFQTMTFGS